MSEGRTSEGERSVRTRFSPRLETLFIATFVLFGFRRGIQPISDNSMFTHLRTGIDMVSGLGIPRVDPYSFTAAGQDWVVQSWLPEFLYGWAHRIGGFRLVLFMQAALICLLVWLVVRMVRAGSPLRTAFGCLLVVGIGSAYWAPRPLLVGMVCMALMITVIEGRRSYWLLVPIVWLWVNSHGSYPLGLAWLAALAVGEAIDWRAWPRDAIRYVGGFVAGLVVSVVNPLGAKLLAFPFTLGSRRDSFEGIVEWMSPNFQQDPARFTLIFLVPALLLLVRARLSWRDVVPVVAFAVAGLVASRNLPIAAIVLAPVLGRVLRRPGWLPPLPATPTSRMRVNRIFGATLAAAFFIFGLSAFGREPVNVRPYPIEATDFLEESGLLEDPHRVAHRDFVGNYFELRFGREVKVFIDDRYDMYPADLARDSRRLLRGHPDWRAILDTHRIDIVLWEPDLPLTSLLELSGQWLEVYSDDDWVVFRRL